MACSVYQIMSMKKREKQRVTYRDDGENNGGDGKGLHLPDLLDAAEVGLGSQTEYCLLQKLFDHGIAPDLRLLEGILLINDHINNKVSQDQEGNTPES